MAFHVTQCPSCESTFNTNAQVLAAASGKVRCGSCLSIFDAVENFVKSASDQDESSDESVFVGNEPDAYFDPSVFLTRSSLQQPTPEPSLPDSPDENLQLLEDTSAANTGQLQVEDGAGHESRSGEPTELVPEHKAISPKELTGESPSSAPATAPPQEKPEDQYPEGDKNENPQLAENQTDIESDLEPDREGQAPAKLENTISANPEDVTLSVSFSLQHSRIKLATDAEPVEFSSAKKDDFKPDGVEPQLSIPADIPIPLDKDGREANLPLNPIAPEETAAATDADSIFTSPAEIAAENPSGSVSENLSPEFDTVITHDGAEINESLQSEFWNSDDAKREALEEAIKNDPALTVKEVITEISPDGDNPPLASDLEQITTSGEYAIEDSSDELEAEFYAAVESGFELEPDIEEETPATSETNPETDENSNQESEANLSTEEIRARALEAEFEDEEALEVIPELNLEALGQMATPVDLGSAKRRHWGTTAALGFVSLLLFAALAGQYFWWNLPLYSQLERFRPAYLFACNYLSCQLPPYSNIDAIVSDELNIRSHPEQDNALAVNISFRNTADFAQRFPVLILSFNSSQNEIIALREFAPSEYLDPSLQRFREMPPGSPVQIELAIMDPGPFAVNYTLAFRNP